MGESRSNHLSSQGQEYPLRRGLDVRIFHHVLASSQDMIFQRMHKPIDLGCCHHSQQFGSKGTSPRVHDVL